MYISQKAGYLRDTVPLWFLSYAAPRSHLSQTLFKWSAATAQEILKSETLFRSDKEERVFSSAQGFQKQKIDFPLTCGFVAEEGVACYIKSSIVSPPFRWTEYSAM